MSADELRQRIAQLEAELAAERQHSTFVGPAIQIPSSSKTSLSEQVLQCKPVLVTEAEAEEEEAAAARTSTAAGPPRAKKGEGDWIPTNLRLLQAAMTQRAVTAAHYAATKAAASAAASEKVLTTLVEKKVYSAHIKAEQEKVKRYREAEVRLRKKEEVLQEMFEDQRNATQLLVWPEITANIGRYNKVTKEAISAAENQAALEAFMHLFEAITSAARNQKDAHVSQPVPAGSDPRSLAYFIQLYQDASVARDKLDLVGTELETLVRSSLSSVADAARHSVTWHIGPLKTVDRSLEKTMDGYTGQFNYLGDIARGSFECTTLTAACAALKALLDLQEQGKILMVRGKNRIDPQFPAEQGGGYRDGLINAILSDGPAGHVCELQIHMTDFLRVKHDGGHASYKAARALHLADPDLLAHRGDFSDSVAEGVAGGMIQSLSLDYSPMSRSQCSRLCEALSKPNCLLHTLSLRMAGVDDSICADLGAAMALNAVERITIAGDNKSKSSVSFGGATSIITACGAALERLDMGSSQLNVPALDVFSVLNTHCVSLRRLDLSKCGITTFLPKERSAWRWAQHLVHLNLEENPLQGELHEVLAQLPSLSELLLGYTKLAGTIPEDIATTGNMRKLDVTATGLKPGQQVLQMAENGEIELIGWTTTQAFGLNEGDRSKLNAFFGGGRFMTTGFTRNDYDGNISRAECAEFKFGKGGVLSGGIDYSTGANYNVAEATKISGLYHFGGLDNPDPDRWSSWTPGDQFFYHEAYHGGKNMFYYSGRVQGDKLIGTYKMGGRNATGTFEWTLTDKLEDFELSEEAATANFPVAASAATGALGHGVTSGPMGVVAVAVSGAGTAVVNGKYEVDGSFNQKPMFTKSGTGLQIWYNHGQWRVGTTNNYFYCVRARAGAPPSSGWSLAQTLCDPSLCAAGVAAPAPSLELIRSEQGEPVKHSSDGAPAGSIIVGGAGNPGANGTYERDGSFNSRPMYTARATGIQIWWNHGQWRLGNTNSYWYTSVSDSSSCPLEGWGLASGTCSPDLCFAGAAGPAPTLHIAE